MAAIVHTPPVNQIVAPLAAIVDSLSGNTIVAHIRAHHEEDFIPDYSGESSLEIVEVENEMKGDHTTITTDTNDGKAIGNINIANETANVHQLLHLTKDIHDIDSKKYQLLRTVDFQPQNES